MAVEPRQGLGQQAGQANARINNARIVAIGARICYLGLIGPASSGLRGFP
jgi:hypothetical protein